MKYIFQNVNLNSINFINNKNDIKFELIDSFINSGKYCGELLCINVIYLKLNTDLSNDPYFPQFICDVSVEHIIENEGEYDCIKFQGGAYDINILCKNIEIVKI